MCTNFTTHPHSNPLQNTCAHVLLRTPASLRRPENSYVASSKMTWINSSGLPNAHNDAYGSGSPRHGGGRAWHRQYGHENVWRWLVRIMKYIWQMVISQTTTIDLRNRKPLVFCWGNLRQRYWTDIGTTIYLSLIALEISSCCSVVVEVIERSSADCTHSLIQQSITE